MAALYLLAGLNHFMNPRMYLRIIPPYIPFPKFANYFSGAAEVLLAVMLCVPFLTGFAAYGIIALLIAIFPSNIYMFTNKKAGAGLPKPVLFIRLLLQPLLILWAFYYI